ncbi:transcriptional regulator, GntR family [Peptostreptococcus stomatis DSM 17678]|uniref:Transcriptional regulator, GntR family n=2 Tax=Peptostreptococcus TaxID=1257 RepID=E0E541_9FIRM|nr:transcriptional regulator, GntR family [Peptostreptococcus stomatis DSM 17678]
MCGVDIMEKMLSSDFIYSDILDRIISLKLSPGSKISENQICEEYNVSRSVIRHIFARLAQINFLTVYPQRGTYVNYIDLEYIRNALLIRLSIEKEILYRFMQKEDKSDIITKMKENMKQQEKFYHENEYLIEFKELDEEFHNYIIMSVENNAILPLINDHLLHISRWRNVYIKSGYKLSKLIDEHKSILEAIEANDTERALRCMNNHIDTVSGIASLDPEYLSYFKGADQDYIKLMK